MSRSLRLLIEVAAAMAAAAAGVVIFGPVIAPQVGEVFVGTIGPLIFVIVAGPVILWRLRASMQRSRTAAATQSSSASWPSLAISASVLLAGLVATGVSVMVASKKVGDEAEARFEHLSERLVAEAQRRVNLPIYGLTAARGIYASSISVERDEFDAFVTPRNLPKEFPGVLGFGVVQRVLRTDIDAFVASQRADGAPEFAVRSLAALGDPLADASDLYVIKHCFPRDRNSLAWGLDLGSETQRRTAVEQAVATGEPTVTGKITLVQDGKRQTGLLYFMPIYRTGTKLTTKSDRQAALVALAYAPIILEEALVGVAETAHGKLDFEIFDGEVPSASNQLYDHDHHLSGAVSTISGSNFSGRMFHSTKSVSIGGHTWTFTNSSTRKFDKTIDRSATNVLSIAGLLISLLASGCTLSLLTGQTRAVAMAKVMTVELGAAKAQAERLAQIARRTSNAVIISDVQGRIEWVNDGFTRISGHSLAEVLGRKPGDFLQGKASDPDAIASMREAIRRGVATNVEIVNYAKDGREYRLRIEITPLRDAEGRLTGFMAIESDITVQHAAQQLLAKAKAAADDALREVGAFRATLDEHSIISVTDPCGKVIDVNESLCRISGYSRAEILGQDHRIFNSGVHSKAFWVDVWRTIAARSAWRGEVCNRAKDGSLYWIDMIIAPFVNADGTLERYVTISNEITSRKRAEQREVVAKQFLFDVVDSLDSELVVLGPDGTVRSCNRVWREFAEANHGLGNALLEGADYLGVCDRAAAKCVEARKVAASIRSVLAGDATPEPVEYPCHSPSERRWFICTVRGFESEGERFAVVSHTSVTALKASQTQLLKLTERFELATRAGGVGTWDYDVVANKIVWDDQMLHLYGLDKDCFGGAYDSWRAGVHPDDRLRCDEEMQAAFGGVRDFNTEFRVVWPDGSEHYIRAIATVQRDASGKPVRMVGTNWDVTARKLDEQRLKAFNGELATARLAAEAASRAKSAFLANMSHEIRTPLTAILGFADVLREDDRNAIPPERRLATIDTICQAGSHLLTVINDILDLSKIEADMMTVEAIETPLLTVLREVEALMRPRAAGRGLMLTTTLLSPLPTRIKSDPTRLRQILMNLVGNAVKFTEAGSVSISAGAAEFDGRSRLVIDVQDTGLGMTPAQAGRAFQAFGQADETVTRKHGGSGLGLTICRRLSALMGGDVKLLSTEPGKGSRFRLVLPLEPVPGSPIASQFDGDERAPAPAVNGLASLNGRILLAEDGPDNQRLIALHLRKAGAIVDIADNGRIAMEKIDNAAGAGTPYDLLLTDMQMPEMDGYTLARTLRQRGSTLAIVALTAHAMAEDRDKCLSAGCDDYATKPIDKHRLRATCAAWMGKVGGKCEVKVTVAA